MLRTRLATAVFIVAAISLACGSAATTPPPPPPTAAPTPTPDPHLTSPASIDKVYSELRKAGLQITANTAESGEDPRKTLNLTYEAWPLTLEEYSSDKAMMTATGFDPKKKPQFGDPPYAFAAMNIYIAYGPQVQSTAPGAPDARFAQAALRLVNVLDPLLGPFQQSSVTPIPLPAATASPSPSPSATPTKKPKKKKKPKPTRKPKP